MSSSIQQLINDFTSATNKKLKGDATSKQFEVAASRLKSELMEEIKRCHEKNETLEESAKLQELVASFATFMSIYREAGAEKQ